MHMPLFSARGSRWKSPVISIPIYKIDMLNIWREYKKKKKRFEQFPNDAVAV